MDEVLYNRECNLLGCLMLETTKITDAMEQLRPEWFTADKLHPMVYAAWRNLRQSSKAVDPVTVFEEVRRSNMLSPVDLDVLFKHLVEINKEAYPAPSTLKQDVKKIRSVGQKADLRKTLIESLHALDEEEDFEAGRTMVMHALDDKLTQGLERGLMTGADIAKMGLDYIDGRLEGKFAGLRTGFDDLDELLFGGFRSGEVYTVFGPAKSGKTTTATSILENIARTPMPCGTMPVIAVFSREMGEVQLAVRHFASLGGASQRNMLVGHMTEDDWNGVSAACGVLANTQLIYDLDSYTPSQIALKCAQIKRKYGRLDLAVVDHLGLIRSDSRKNSIREELVEITWAFKQMAKRMGVAVMQVAQANRKHADRQDKTPILADLAESGSIEKDSDAIIGIVSHRDGELKGWVEIHVVAARMGTQGVCPAVFSNGRILPGQMSEYLSCKNRAEQSGKSERRKNEI